MGKYSIHIFMEGNRCFSIIWQLIDMLCILFTLFLVNIFTVSWKKVILVTFVLPIHFYEGNPTLTPLKEYTLMSSCSTTFLGDVDSRFS